MKEAKTAGTETMRVTRNIQDEELAEWLQAAPESEIAALYERAVAADEEAWQRKFTETAPQLDELGEQAREEATHGDTLPFDPSELAGSDFEN